MAETDPFRVVVVGGGVAGLTLANALEVPNPPHAVHHQHHVDRPLASWGRLCPAGAPQPSSPSGRRLNWHVPQRCPRE